MIRSLLFISLLIIVSCNDKNKGQPQHSVPEALQDDNKKSGIELVSKRGYDDSRDLVEELYKEKLEKTPALLSIDKLYKDLKDSKPDSLEESENYVQKNNEYYESTDSHLERIKDSLLKKEIGTVLANSIAGFNAKSGRLAALKDALNRADASADDRYIAMKLLITLNMIELYQDNLPSSKPIESLIASFNQLNKKLDSVIYQNK